MGDGVNIAARLEGIAQSSRSNLSGMDGDDSSKTSSANPDLVYEYIIRCRF
jgi:hypothetical protein